MLKVKMRTDKDGKNCNKEYDVEVCGVTLATASDKLTIND